MAVYLLENPPAVSQFRRTRRAKPSGVVVLHTAESQADVNPPDNGAANVARFIANRRTFGSYHVIVDSDDAIQLCEWWWEAYHVGTHRMNHHSVGISVAAEAARWRSYPDDWVEGAVDNAARMAAVYASWVEKNHGIVVPATRINASTAIARKPGFTTHGELDPTRRSDPGADFPWDYFLERYEHHSGNPGDNTGGGTVPLNDRQAETVRRIQKALIDAGYDLGSFGADGDPGPLTESAVDAALEDLAEYKSDFQTANGQLRELRADHESLNAELASTAIALEDCQAGADEGNLATDIGLDFIDLVQRAAEADLDLLEPDDETVD